MITLRGMAEHRFNIVFTYQCLKEKRTIGNYTAYLIILQYDLFGENHTPLQRNGMAANPRTRIMNSVKCNF